MKRRAAGASCLLLAAVLGYWEVSHWFLLLAAFHVPILIGTGYWFLRQKSPRTAKLEGWLEGGKVKNRLGDDRKVLIAASLLMLAPVIYSVYDYYQMLDFYRSHGSYGQELQKCSSFPIYSTPWRESAPDSAYGAELRYDEFLSHAKETHSRIYFGIIMKAPEPTGDRYGFWFMDESGKFGQSQVLVTFECAP